MNAGLENESSNNANRVEYLHTKYESRVPVVDPPDIFVKRRPYEIFRPSSFEDLSSY